MSMVFEERPSDSPFVETITHGWTLGSGSTIRPAECNWHMVLARYAGESHMLVVGPWTTSGVVSWGAGAEILWIRFKLGSFMPHLSPQDALDNEAALPGASSRSFWLKGSTWQFPDHQNADTFVDRLAKQDVLVFDPLVTGVLQGHTQPLSARSIRHHFLRATGLTRSHILQVERAKRAAKLLEQGVPILDAVHAAGYFDQPHMTRALKRWVGYTPARISRAESAG